MARNCTSSLLSHGCPVSLLSAADFLFQSQPGFTCWLPSRCCDKMPKRIDFYRRSFVLAHKIPRFGSVDGWTCPSGLWPVKSIMVRKLGTLW